MVAALTGRRIGFRLDPRVLAAIGGAVAVGVGASASPSITLAAAGGLLIAVVGFRNLALGVVLLTLLTFFDRGTALAGVGLTPVKLVGAIVTLMWLPLVIDRSARSPMLFREHPFLAAAAITFSGWMIASIAWAPDASTAVGGAFRVIQNVLLVFIVFSAVTEIKHIWWLTSAFIAGTVGTVFLGLIGIYRAGPVNDYRLTGGFDDPNQLGAAIVPAIVLSGFAFLALPRQKRRWLLLLALPLLGKALFRTESQFAIIALAFGFLLALFYAGPGRRYVAAAVAAGVLFVGAYYTFYQPPVLFTTMFSTQNTSGRVDLWKVATQMAKTRPLTGIGVDNFSVLEPSYALSDLNLPRVDIIAGRPHAVHNTYLETLTELGAVGLALLLALMAAPIVLGIRAVRAFGGAQDRSTELLVRGFVVAAIAMDAAFFDFSAEVEKQLWLFVGLGAAIASIARRAEADAFAARKLRLPDVVTRIPVRRAARARVAPGGATSG
jgi:O-antigen ligase